MNDLPTPMTGTDDVVLLERCIEPMLDAWLRRWAVPAWRGARIDGWSFDAPARRRVAHRAPHDMRHAARHTALGDDLQTRLAPPLHERALREELLRRSGARLHVSLHGYPAHEWIRPFSGYVPRDFDAWTLPRGFFRLVRQHVGLQDLAMRLVQAVCVQLDRVSGYRAFNARQRTLHAAHAGPSGFARCRGTAWTAAPTLDGPPLTLVTEFPDETIDGDAFCIAHTVQMTAALAAWHAWQRLCDG